MLRTAVSLAMPGASRALSVRAMATDASYKLLIIGAGPGGLSVGSTLANELGEGKVGIIEPADVHAYQPMWTLVGAGIKSLEQSLRPMKDVIPDNIKWHKTAATEFHPKEGVVVTADGKRIGFDLLVVATGMQIRVDKIDGLQEALDSPHVSTNYIGKYASKTWELIKSTKGGSAIFTFPTGPMKCAGAPQKIMYLAEDYWRNKAGNRGDVDVIYNTALPRIFGVEKYANRLRAICQDRNINVNYSLDLVQVDAVNRSAVFQATVNGAPVGERTTFKYDMMHVAPKMGPVQAISESPLANAAGFVDVDDHTLQHNTYDNVFSLGDCSSLPTSKTAAAISEQSGVLKANLRAVMKGRVKPRRYNGYTSCPLTTGYNSLILAEFDYTGQPLESFPIDQSQERSLMMMLKRDVMPSLYWHALLKGRWEGPGTMRKFAGINAV